MTVIVQKRRRASTISTMARRRGYLSHLPRVRLGFGVKQTPSQSATASPCTLTHVCFTHVTGLRGSRPAGHVCVSATPGDFQSVPTQATSLVRFV